ncbi:gp050 [Erwinia phage vB_EamP-S6]|uniref:Gp050 n=1 Tax=Erwinia phage vB_EamP-S6 TaxID=1051675 RepID=G0YQE2_9CAUD|nr:gp050 [Erwinia phage vB_EamP-S6]AEJ81569.1 gp050 [Erwinia phage vB_EamP-S6]
MIRPNPLSVVRTFTGDRSLSRRGNFLSPVFSSQPQTQALYQNGGTLTISGAAASPITGYQWQKANADGSWSNVANQTNAVFSKTSGLTISDQGSYRLLAINGDKQTVSNTVDVVDVYVKFQNDISGQSQQVVKVDNQNYTFDAPSGTRYIGIFYMRFDNDTNFIPTGAGGSRFSSGFWSSTNTDVAPLPSSNPAQQNVANLRAGTAEYTVTDGIITSKLKVTIT